NHPDPTEGHQHQRSTRPPQQRGCVPESLHMSQRMCDCLKIVAGGQDATRADQPADLKRQREKCRKVDCAQHAQKKPSRDQAVRGPLTLRKEPTQGGGKTPTHDVALYEGTVVTTRKGPPAAPKPQITNHSTSVPARSLSAGRAGRLVVGCRAIPILLTQYAFV